MVDSRASIPSILTKYLSEVLTIADSEVLSEVNGRLAVYSPARLSQIATSEVSILDGCISDD